MDANVRFIKDIAEVVKEAKRALLIDSMSAFGALDVSAKSIPFDALVASSNKCLEGSPGMGFCLADKSALLKTEGNADSLCFDLLEQWKGLEANGQWRFTPPTHCILAFHQALVEFDEERRVYADIPEQGPIDDGYRVPHSTLHVGPIQGGRALNIVPDSCEFSFEVRHLPEE